MQIVTDAKRKPAETLGFQLHGVAILERIETAMIGAGGQDVTRIERVDRRRPLDTAGDLVGHIIGIEALHQRAVGPQVDRQLVWVSDLIGGDDVRTDRRECVA